MTNIYFHDYVHCLFKIPCSLLILTNGLKIQWMQSNLNVRQKLSVTLRDGRQIPLGKRKVHQRRSWMLYVLVTAVTMETVNKVVFSYPAYLDVETTSENYINNNVILYSYLSRWQSCLDRGALINVDAPGCGTSVVRGPTGHK